MAKEYQPKPPVICEHCGVSFSRRRPSKTGIYFCGKQECQAERQRQYMAEARLEKRTLADAERELVERGSATFLAAVLRAPRVQCPSCGLRNGLRGFAHMDAAGEGCGGLGGRVEGVTRAHIVAAWPDDEREYAVI